MNKQIKRLIELSEPLKMALIKHFEPNCGWVYSPLKIKDLEIYLNNGYNAFAFRYQKERIELVKLSMYSNKIELHFSATVKDLNEFINIVEDAIITLNKADESLKEKRIAEKKAELLKQLKHLEGGNND